MRTLVVIGLLCVLFAGLGWYFRGVLDYKHFENHLAQADSIQTRVDSLEKVLVVARRSIAESEKVALIEQVKHENALASLSVQHHMLVDSLKHIQGIPLEAQKLISELETNHETERAVWISETGLLKAQLQAEKDLRAADERQLLNLGAENASLRAAVNAKPNQVVLTKKGPWVVTTIVEAAVITGLVLSK